MNKCHVRAVSESFTRKFSQVVSFKFIQVSSFKFFQGHYLRSSLKCSVIQFNLQFTSSWTAVCSHKRYKSNSQILSGHLLPFEVCFSRRTDPFDPCVNSMLVLLVASAALFPCLPQIGWVVNTAYTHFLYLICPGIIGSCFSTKSLSFSRDGSN